MYPPLIGLREFAYDALDGLEYDSPLRLGLHDAERADLQLRLERNPNAELRVISHLLTGTGAGGWPPRAARLPLTRASSSHVLWHDA